MLRAGEPYRRSVRPEGFTLIELLVVISVLAVLMVILTPARSAARKLGQSVVCQAHLRQWDAIFFLYTTDNGGRFWTEHNVWQTGVAQGGWRFPDPGLAGAEGVNLHRVSSMSKAGGHVVRLSRRKEVFAQ